MLDFILIALTCYYSVAHLLTLVLNNSTEEETGQKDEEIEGGGGEEGGRTGEVASQSQDAQSEGG